MSKRTLFPIVMALALVATSCSVPGPVQSTQNLDPIRTQAAETLVAALTQNPPTGETAGATATGAVILPSTDTPAALETNTPAPTDAPAATDTPAATATSQASPTVQATLTPTRHPGIIFEEDFSNEVGWYVDERSEWVFEFVDGKYRITNNIPGAVLWSVREVPYNDVRVEVDGVRTAGPQNGFYGVTCRYVDEDNYYAMVVASNGFYAIARMRDGSIQFRVTGTDVSGTIRPGSEGNRVRGDCIGSTLTLYVNGVKIAEETDEFFDEGWVGVVAGNRIEPGIQAAFDNFVVIRP